MKKAFMSLKFHNGLEDKNKIDGLTSALLKAGIQNVVMARDVEKYGEAILPKDAKLMPDYAFPAMKQCDMLIVEFSEKGVRTWNWCWLCLCYWTPYLCYCKNW